MTTATTSSTVSPTTTMATQSPPTPLTPSYSASAGVNYASAGSAQAGFTLAAGTSYNALGQKASITYPDGAQYSYTFDANNQLSTVNFPVGFGSITINSYLWTVPSQITLPGGTVRNMSYDGLLRLKTLAVKDPGQSQVLSYQYNYDLTSNIVAKATEAGNTNYSYDTLDRLTAAAYTGSTQTNETYSYDGVANRLTDSKTATATWVYNANNQLTAAGTITYSYDANGNTTSQTDSANASNTRNYVYDTDNRLIEVRNASNTLIAAYSYDPFGRRLSKDVGTQKTYYLYNEEGLIAEADATGVLTKSYGYAPNSTFSTNPLWMKTGTAYYTYQNDHLGTPMKLLSQSGAVVWSASYDSFGKASVNPASTITNNLRFPGQYADAETGLHYNWHRYYDPQSGRFTTSDPIGLRGGINTYTYVYSNPLHYDDPLGLFGYSGGTSVTTTAIVGGGVTGGTNGQFFSDGSASAYGVKGTGWGADVSADAQVNGALYFGSGSGGASSWAGDFTAINVGAFGFVGSVFWGGGWFGVSGGAGVAPEGADFGATVTNTTYVPIPTMPTPNPPVPTNPCSK